MTHVITQACCNDASCVPACPVNCIHPAPGEPDFAAAEMLYIDPNACIDCGACVDVCPVGAVSADFELDPGDEPFLELNRRWSADRDPVPVAVPAASSPPPLPPGPLRVAVVGSGPAAQYVVDELTATSGVDVAVTVFERLLTPGGLVRFGIAPDHLRTKRVGDRLARSLRRPGVGVRLGVEVGSDIGVDELLASHHALVVATGASADRSLGIPGESLSGSHAAGDFVGWYNGHPDCAGRVFDLSAERAVVVGNGNVALDVARILLADVDTLARTDIPEGVLNALSANRIREVVVLGRRGAESAAFTASELLGLRKQPGLTLTAQRVEPAAEALREPARFKVDQLGRCADADPGERTLTLRFWSAPVRMLGTDRVRGIQVVDSRTGESEDLACGLVIRAIGHRGEALPGLPFDEVRGVIPHVGGRVMNPDTGQRVSGVYTAGWIKRGPSGGVGTNKLCAKETVAALIEDFRDGTLAAPRAAADVSGLGSDLTAWEAIDAYERAAGRAVRRPRVKVANPEQLSRIAASVTT